MWYQNIRSVLFSFVTQYTHLTDGQTDRRTDGQTEFRQQYHALHYMQSHGKNGGLNQYGAEPSEQQQFGTAGVERIRCNIVVLSFYLHVVPPQENDPPVSTEIVNWYLVADMSC